MDQFKDLGFAKLDLTRADRTGQGEPVCCPGKTPEQLTEIMRTFPRTGVRVPGAKCSPEQFAFQRNHSIPAEYDETSRLLISPWGRKMEFAGLIAVCTGGTADLPVAEEAAHTAEFFGAKVKRCFDVGVAGLHRLLAKIDAIRRADAGIAAAGMGGAPGSVLAGLVESPLVAVPTSVGCGAGFGVVAPLPAMLNSCAEGMSVVNMDNGFGAGVLACRMIRRMERRIK